MQATKVTFYQEPGTSIKGSPENDIDMTDIKHLEQLQNNIYSMTQGKCVFSSKSCGTTHSDAASFVLEGACPSPLGVMFRGTGLFLGAISFTTPTLLFQIKH